MKKWFLLMVFLSFWLTACSSAPKKMTGQEIFPYGIYQHQITVHTKNTTLNFQGINQWTAEKFVVVGLGPMDMTVLKYEEDRVAYTKNLFINKEILPIDESRAYQLISLLREMYSWDRSICKEKICEDSYWGLPIKIELGEKNQVSKILVVRGDIEVIVDVKNYETVL